MGPRRRLARPEPGAGEDGSDRRRGRRGRAASARAPAARAATPAAWRPAEPARSGVQSAGDRRGARARARSLRRLVGGARGASHGSARRPRARGAAGRSILPREVRGISGTRMTLRGTLWAERCSRHQARTCSQRRRPGRQAITARTHLRRRARPPARRAPTTSSTPASPPRTPSTSRGFDLLALDVDQVVEAAAQDQLAVAARPPRSPAMKRPSARRGSASGT